MPNNGYSKWSIMAFIMQHPFKFKSPLYRTFNSSAKDIGIRFLVLEATDAEQLHGKED
jgi:hypothetical protein